ncbi:MAG: hypothetical protein P8N25_02460 [Alphaproteobacteria bacterium]|nr:hypothetical protein [Alphaproteobacteria bacterium]
MKKLVLITSGLLLPLASFAHDEGFNDHQSLNKKIDLGYQVETVKNDKYQTRKTNYYSVNGVITNIGGGELSMGYIRRNEERMSKLAIGELKGQEKADILSLKYVKVEPSWGFWGGAVAYGRTSQDVNMKYVNTTTNIGAGGVSVSTAKSKVNESGIEGYRVSSSESLAKKYFGLLDSGISGTNAIGSAVSHLGGLVKQAATLDLTITSALYGKENSSSFGGDSDYTRAGKTFKGNKGATITSYTAFVGTKLSASGIDFIPMAKYTINNKKMDDVTLNNSDVSLSSIFSIKSAKEKSLELSLTAQKKIAKGMLSLNATSVDTKGTDIMYGLSGTGNTLLTSDNPAKRRAMSYRIGYNLPLVENTNLDLSWKYYKNGKSVTRTVYLGLGYTF